MAIAFSTGTINQPDAGSVGLAMVEKIRDDVVAHPAWELVEEFTAASGLVRWYVFKCLAAQSGLPADFFVVIGRTLGDGVLRAFVCEGYDSATHTASKFCIANPASTQFLYDNLGRIPQTYVLGTAVLSNTGLTPYYGNCTWAPSGTSTKWWLTVADDGFTVAFNGASNGVMHLGAYIPLCELPIALPLHYFGFFSNQWKGGITRNPAVANVNHYGTALQTDQQGITGAVLGFYSELRYADALQGGKRSVAEIGIVIEQNQGISTQAPITGYILGKIKRIRWSPTTTPPGVAFGDAYVLQGKLWVPYLPTDGRMWDTGVTA